MAIVEQVIIGMVVGVVVGIITGVLPSVHVNLISVGVLWLYRQHGLDPVVGTSAILAVAVVHASMEIIPSLVYGVPSSSFALLPSHILLHQGRGYDALAHAVFGSLGGVFLSILSLPLFVLFIERYADFTFFIPYAVLCLFLYDVVSDQHLGRACLLAACSGLVGLIVLRSSLNEPLLLLLTGFFGVSSNVRGLCTDVRLPSQKLSTTFRCRTYDVIRLVVLTPVMLVLSVLPTIGTAQAAMVLEMFSRQKDSLFSCFCAGVLNSVSLIGSMAFLVLAQRSRAGFADAMMQMTSAEPSAVLVYGLITGIVMAGSAVITLFIGKRAMMYVHVIPRRMLSAIVILFLAILTMAVVGSVGLIVVVLCASLGMLAQEWQCRKSNLLAGITVPYLLT